MKKIRRIAAVHIAVMDYGYGEIRMYKAYLPQEWQNDDVVNWLLEHDEKYKDTQCYYMASEDEIEVKYE